MVGWLRNISSWCVLSVITNFRGALWFGVSLYAQICMRKIEVRYCAPYFSIQRFTNTWKFLNDQSKWSSIQRDKQNEDEHSCSRLFRKNYQTQVRFDMQLPGWVIRLCLTWLPLGIVLLIVVQAGLRLGFKPGTLGSFDSLLVVFSTLAFAGLFNVHRY